MTVCDRCTSTYAKKYLNLPYEVWSYTQRYLFIMNTIWYGFASCHHFINIKVRTWYGTVLYGTARAARHCAVTGNIYRTLIITVPYGTVHKCTAPFCISQSVSQSVLHTSNAWMIVLYLLYKRSNYSEYL